MDIMTSMQKMIIQVMSNKHSYLRQFSIILYQPSTDEICFSWSYSHISYWYYFCFIDKIETLFDFMDMQNEKSIELLQLTTLKLGDIARFCNRYPNIEISDEISDQDDITFASTVNVHVTLECLDQLLASVIAPLFQQKCKEGCESVQLL